jgi:hypothetical protein
MVEVRNGKSNPARILLPVLYRYRLGGGRGGLMETGLTIVALVFAKNMKGEEEPTPIVVGPFKDRIAAFNWERGYRSREGVSRIEIRNAVPLA